MAATIIATPVTAHASLLSDIWQAVVGKADGASNESSSAALSLPLLGTGATGIAPIDPGDVDSDPKSDVPLSVMQDNALVATRNPQGTLSNNSNDKIIVYQVQEGDTPGIIAQKFGITLNTLLWANNISNSQTIKEGDELVILPVSGIKYTVKKGDTIDSIATRFKGDSQDILSFNGIGIGEDLQAGTDIIIPDGENATPPTPAKRTVATTNRFSSFPDYKGYYMRPIFGGRKSRGIHGYNGVDLANSCGLPVVASAEGNLIVAKSSGWNGGYGKYIVIAHPNGTQTLYAHLSLILGSVGQHVSQGSQIALIGSTGNSTGCHVHFEIRGAKNPF